MFVRVAFILAVLLALLDIQTIVGGGNEPLAVDVASLVLGLGTVAAVIAYRRLPVPAVVTVIVTRVLSGVLAVGGLLVPKSVPTDARVILWAFLVVTVVAVALLACGLARRTRGPVPAS